MDIRFRDYTIGERSGRDTFKVITDYAHYPRFNPAVVEETRHHLERRVNAIALS